jgi:hypothetical protein
MTLQGCGEVMTDMIELMARAIEKADDDHFDATENPLVPYEVLARAAIEAHKKALENAGFVIVPREPTEAMMKAAENHPVTKKVNAMVTLAFIHGMKSDWPEEDPPLKSWYRTMIAEALK